MVGEMCNEGGRVEKRQVRAMGIRRGIKEIGNDSK